MDARQQDNDSGKQETAGGWLRRLLPWRHDEPTLRESLEEVIEEHDEDGDAARLDDEGRSMMLNIIDASEMRIDDIMVPRADIDAVDLAAGFDELVRTLCAGAHSRVPVYRETLDDVVGMIHAKDVLACLAAMQKGEPAPDVKDLLRPAIFAAPSMRLNKLLTEMRVKRTHMALVVDEYGGIDGLVTIEDLVEPIVGDIEDEYDDEDEARLKPIGGGRFDADARVEIEDLEAATGLGFLDPDEDIHTLGGLVVTLAGKVPEIGEVLTHESGYRFEVVDADPRRLKRIRIYPPRQEPAS